LVSVAIPVFDELQITAVSVCVLLLLNVPVAMKLCTVPAVAVGVAGLMAIDTRFAGVRLFGW